MLRSLTKTANGGVKVVTYKRIDEFNETVYSMMKAQHVLSPVVETEETFIPDNGQAKLIKQVRFDYVPCSLASASCFPLSTIKEKTGSAPLREVYTCHEHNMKGNPVYVTQHDGLDVVYMWNGSDRYLIAKITNVTLSDFREALLTAVGANEFIWANQLRAKLPSAHITTYQYKPGVGVVTVIEPNENEKRFEYNSRGNLETEMILEYLKKKGASDDCYILSSMSSLDKRNLLLRDALDSVYGRGFGCIISCVPGVLLYYEGEDMRVIINAIQI